PWVLPSNGAAALVLLGLDLGDFWKYTGEWRGGLFQWERVFFFLPPVLAVIILALWISGHRGSWRLLLLPLLLGLSLVVLPALDILRPAMAWLPPRITDPAIAREFTFQLWLTLLALATVLLIPLWQRAGNTLRLLLIAVAAFAGALLPTWALWRTWLVLSGLYAGQLLPGPGIAISAGGFALAALTALLPLARSSGYTSLASG
ncbi:MAG: hypothetical protein ACRDIB_06235, partial [Ardenticatenaceae bacterium]